LAARFRVCLPARLFNGGRARPHAGFFPEDIGTYLAAARRRKSRPVPFALALVKAAEKTRTRKRGGGVEFVSWDDWMAEAPSQLSISAHALDSLPAERLFDFRWATTVVEQALRRLREECEGKDRLRLFYALSRHLTDERDEVSYANLSAALGVAETAVKKQLHIMRQRYRSLLRDEVAHTVENPADVQDEIRYLCAALAAGTG
jgi:RNA polymerase sigma-70 factor (ECF subfamily)